MKSVLFFLESWDELKRWENHESISPNKEDYSRCVARQYWEEIETCRRMNFQYFFAVKDRDAEIGYNPHTQSSFFPGKNPLSLFTPEGNQVHALEGYKMLIRCSVPHESVCTGLIESLGGESLVSEEENKFVKQWYKVVNLSYLGRQHDWFCIDGLEGRYFKMKDRLEIVAVEGKVFVKLEHKSTLMESGLYSTQEAAENLMHVSLNLTGSEVFISSPLKIQQDAKGKLEYRFFVVNGKPVSPSRYLDYDTDYDVPPIVIAFAQAFAKEHFLQMPNGYTLDVALCEDGKVVLIELNSINASGRYERNNFEEILNAL